MVKFARLKVVKNTEGLNVVLTRNGEIVLLDPKGRELEQYEIPTGAQLMVDEDQEVAPNTVLCQWDPHSIPILSEVSGKVRFEDVVDGETSRTEKDQSGHMRRMIQEHKGELHPQVILEDNDGKILDFYYLPEKGVYRSRRRRPSGAGCIASENASRSCRNSRHHGWSATRDPRFLKLASRKSQP